MMFQKPKVHIIETIKDNDEKGGILLKVYAIVQIPTFENTIIINFDNFFSPSFQGLINYDIFPNYDEACNYIRCTNREDNVFYNEYTAIAIAGYINNSQLILIEEAEPIKFQDQELFYKIKSFKKIIMKKEKSKQILESYRVDDYFYSFSSDIISFQEKKNNKNYNYFHMNQKPFVRLQINVCPFIINGYVVREKITSDSEVLLICRRSRYAKEIPSGMNENGITRDQTEIEMIISRQNNIGKELSLFTETFGDVPIIYKINDVKGQIFDEIDEYSFISSPKLIFNLLGDRKEKMNNDIFLIDAIQQQQNVSQKSDFNVAVRQMVSFLSGVFQIKHIQIDIDTKIDENDIIEQIYSLFPSIEMRKLLFYDESVHQLNDTNQIFYIFSNYGNFNAEFVSIVLLSKAFKSVFTEFGNSASFIFSLLSPFFKKIVNSNKNDLQFLKDLVEIQLSKPNEPENLSPPEDMERCVSLFPTSTIIWPNKMNCYILSPFYTRIFYQTPNDPIIINLTEACRISRILFLPANNGRSGNIYKVSASMVSIYGGLYLNQMFPIVENLVLAPTVETSYRVNLKQDDRYSTEPKYSKYGKVRFVSFKFQSLFENFYISNFYVFTDGSKVLEFPKSIKNESFSKLQNECPHQFIENEIRRLENQESIQIYASRNQDKLQDLIEVNSYFKNYSIAKKNDDQSKYFELINDNLMKNELIMIYKKYPFLNSKFKLKSNFMKHYSSNSIYMPFLIASGPPLFEYVISQQSDLDNFKIFQPKESIIILRLVLLQSYSIDSIEIRCNNPLFVEVINSDFSFSDLFLPPGGEQFFPYNGRVIDIKLKGNPINISFLGFKSTSRKISNEGTLDDIFKNGKNISADIEEESLKCIQKDVIIADSKIDKINADMKIIGIKLNGRYFANFAPQYFLFDDQVFSVKMNPGSTFFFPNIIRSNSIKIFFKGISKNQRIVSDAVIIMLQDQEDMENHDIQEKLKIIPHSIQILGSSTFSPMKYFEKIRHI